MIVHRGSCVIAAAVALGALTAPTRAQAQAERTGVPLSFLGITAGESLDSLTALIKADGGTLLCNASRSDPRVRDCRATYLVEGTPIDLWLSSIDGTVAIVTLATPLDQNLLTTWRTDLETRYGRGLAKAQGPQWMLQWVRQNRMLRLVWRIDGGERRISVSLVDGPSLDGWSAPHTATRRSAAPSPAPLHRSGTVPAADRP
jgi:hypothetical protein